ncbi:hypothetical protein FACS1894139_14990 [Planctomycetales bacterium]|nr:hypothetical protein FACS1894108_09940 [Planctomycetales bacterium]GHT07206.1 hypothetical protein FACS1894139_14990 [Planctomycetales bacterium]
MSSREVCLSLIKNFSAEQLAALARMLEAVAAFTRRGDALSEPRVDLRRDGVVFDIVGELAQAGQKRAVVRRGGGGG